MSQFQGRHDDNGERTSILVDEESPSQNESPEAHPTGLEATTTSLSPELLINREIPLRPSIASDTLPSPPESTTDLSSFPLYEAEPADSTPDQAENALGIDNSEGQDGDRPPEKDASGKEKRTEAKLEEPDQDKVLKLSPSKIHELTSSPQSIPMHTVPPPILPSPLPLASISESEDKEKPSNPSRPAKDTEHELPSNGRLRSGSSGMSSSIPKRESKNMSSMPFNEFTPNTRGASRPSLISRTVSTPPTIRKKPSSMKLTENTQGSTPQLHGRIIPGPLNLGDSKSSTRKSSLIPDPVPSPMPPSIPLPPRSIPTYLQLELSSERPSPLYIHRSAASDFPYESSKVKFERLLNFLLLPPQLEQVLWFGALACLDAWLYTFTILPLRFLKALGVLGQWWAQNASKETKDMSNFIYEGLGRMWQRRRRRRQSSVSASGEGPADAIRSEIAHNSTKEPHSPKHASISAENGSATIKQSEPDRKHLRISAQKHRRTRSVPSALLPSHKADILQGFLVLLSCVILMYFDASRMYHGIRGQAAIKLYVIYNVLEVCDRLFSALGQDVLECLFSKETLERKADGRSKVLRPLWMFLLALIYNVVHATALFYQVITLNVAVNSYSNALLTLLMSNQFVEIKGTVFKKFEKENLFQLTCADVVERFQLWLMLLIIALRNIVEMGGLSIGSSLSGGGDTSNNNPLGDNLTGSSMPLRSSSILPKSFTIFPKWTGQVMGPFLLVLGSEMLVDWLKHAYITKFNNVKPAVYGRYLDVLAKDYYSNAFADQNLTRRLGLPVIPLSCLFIRSSVQTYHMFLATQMPLPYPSSSTSISVDASTASPATTAALAHIDHIFRRALGRSSFGAGGGYPSPTPGANDYSGWLSSSLGGWITWRSADDAIAFATMLLFFLVIFLVLLAAKLVLGMILLSFARTRYRGMKTREKGASYDTGGRRVGGWGVVEVDEDKRRWIYVDDPEGARALRERERAAREREGREREGTAGGKGGGGSNNTGFEGVNRYSMVAKRIW
ncbi:MAG: hypothetical protein M1819_001759 [Sarea resinae]|nr:MAG: hypothetical protein M1819_001759 [Sarea resinae]